MPGDVTQSNTRNSPAPLMRQREARVGKLLLSSSVTLYTAMTIAGISPNHPA